MQRAAAAASENSALERLESGLGNACSQAEESLSLCNQDQTGRFERSCFGWFSRPFLIRLAQVLSLSSEIFPLVLPSQELSPTQPTWTLRFSWGTTPSQSAASLVPQPTCSWKWVGGTKGSKRAFFSLTAVFSAKNGRKLKNGLFLESAVREFSENGFGSEKN